MPSALTETCKDIESLMDRLIDLGTMIRKSGLTSRLLRADLSFSPEPHRYLEWHLQLLLRLQNIRSYKPADNQQVGQTPEAVLSLLPTTPLRADQIYLVEANLRRRHRFAFARKRAATLARPRETYDTLPSGASILLTNDVEQHNHQGHLQADSMAARSTAIPSQLSASAIEPGADISRIVESELHGETPVYLPEASTQLSEIAAKMKYPQPPKVSQQQAFKCAACHQIQPKRIGANRRRWKYVSDIARQYRPTLTDGGCEQKTYRPRSISIHLPSGKVQIGHHILCEKERLEEPPLRMPSSVLSFGLLCLWRGHKVYRPEAFRTAPSTATQLHNH